MKKATYFRRKVSYYCGLYSKKILAEDKIFVALLNFLSKQCKECSLVKMFLLFMHGERPYAQKRFKNNFERIVSALKEREKQFTNLSHGYKILAIIKMPCS